MIFFNTFEYYMKKLIAYKKNKNINNFINNYLLDNQINRKIIKENALYNFYIINLIKRKDRYNHIINEFNDFNINLYFMDAFEENNGVIGCKKSHLYLINYAKKNNLPYIIVVEDDFLLNPTINKQQMYEILNILTTNYDKFEIFNGSPTFWDKRYSLNEIKKSKSFINDFYFITNGQKTTFIIYTNLMYDKILNELNSYDEKYHIDQYIANNYIQLCYKKYICYEINNYSDIANKNVNNVDYIKKEEDFYINLII